MLVLMQGPLATSPADDARPGLVAAAQALGHRVHVIPPEGSLADAEPSLDRGDFQWGVLFGSALDPARYQQLHDEARALNITLLNDPAQRSNAFDGTVLEGLTTCPVPWRELEKQGAALKRAYRLFVLDADVLAMGFAAVPEDPFGALTERDERELRALAHEAARRTRVPWLTVDVGQLENGDWRIIKTFDPSSSALTTVNPRDLLGALANGLEHRTGC